MFFLIVKSEVLSKIKEISGGYGNISLEGRIEGKVVGEKNNTNSKIHKETQYFFLLKSRYIIYECVFAQTLLFEVIMLPSKNHGLFTKLVTDLENLTLSSCSGNSNTLLR